MLVNALVFPQVEYACLVYNRLPDYLDLKVRQLIDAGIRYM